MKLKRLTSLFVALAVCAACYVPYITADANATYKICSCGGNATLYCNYYTFGVSATSNGSNTHTHSFHSCTRTYYRSYGRYYCSSCGAKSFYTNGSGVATKHDCYTYHSYTGSKECTCPIYTGYSPTSDEDDSDI